ncbi:MAG: hypothetical protein WEC73_02650 [Chthoniobacterales bacterium]
MAASGAEATEVKCARLPKLAAVAAVACLVVSGCRWEVGKVPLPSPSPTPSPSPSPANNDFAFAPAALETAGAPVPLSQQVALANADMMTATSATAAEEVSRFTASARQVAAAPVTAGDEFAAALSSLTAAAEAYRRAEASVFYVDPDSTDELRAQPDPLGIGSGGEPVDPFAEISARLTRLAKLTAGQMNEEIVSEVLRLLRELAEASDKLSADIDTLAAAWAKDEGESFRSKYFLASHELAVARIFQGLLALTGDVLPGFVRSDDVAPVEITGRMQAVRDIYLGIAPGEPEGQPGLHDLVFASAPAQALATYGAVAQALALAEAVALAPGNGETRRQLDAALANATRQLEFAAAAVGIQIVEVAD